MTKDFEIFYAAATVLLRIGQERSKMGARALDFDDIGGAREDETGMGSGMGKSEGLWWHVGALAAAVRSALIRPRTQRRSATRPSLAPGTQ